MKLIPIAAIAVVALLSGCAVSATETSPTPTPTTTPSIFIAGVVSTPLDLSAFTASGEDAAIGVPCTSSAGYDDIHDGAQVIISDQTGTTIGLTTLGAGQLLAKEGDSLFAARCAYKFQQTVPGGATFYGLHAGNANRGVVQYSPEDVRNLIQLTLGD